MIMMTAFKLVLVALVVSTAWAATATKTMYGEEYMPTPQGYVLAHCHHRVSSGSVISHLPDARLKVTRADGSFDRVLPVCRSKMGAPTFVSKRDAAAGSGSGSPLDYDGWLAYTAFHLDTHTNASFDSFLGKFSVPSAPADDPEVLYLFTGLQNIDWIPAVDPQPTTPFDIIQPVLQYPGDDGDYWSVKSWYVTLDVGTVASDEVRTTPGDAIFGNMTRVGAQSWFIGSTAISTGAITSVTVTHPRLAAQPWAYNTLECYGCSGCGTYPTDSPCDFTAMELTAAGQRVTPKWVVNPKPSPNKQCYEMPVVNSPTDVTIYFDKQ